jgi:hypothetical protein
MSQVIEAEYKGNPMLIIRSGEQDQFPFQFGLRKAQLILANLDDIKTFVQKHKTPKA